jgi:hypothetical protein
MSDTELNFVLGVLTGIVLTFFVVYMYIRNLVVKVLSEIDQQITKVKDKLMPVTIERVNGQLFCYTEEDKQFICQGANMAEIKKAFEARFPDRTAFLSNGEESLLKELREQLKELNEASDSK